MRWGLTTGITVAFLWAAVQNLVGLDNGGQVLAALVATLWQGVLFGCLVAIPFSFLFWLLGPLFERVRRD